MSFHLILKYFPDLNDDSKEKMKNLFNLYENVNKKVNLISRKDFDFFYERHVLHSLSISKVFRFKNNDDVMDLGTGGGFPGIPLAILFPDSNFFLVDSIKKKIDCLSKIVLDLNLPNVKVINARSETLDYKFDFIISRAVASLSKLDSWTKGKFKNNQRNGLICLKGGDLRNEIKGFENRLKTFNISNFFEEDFFSSKKIIFLEEKK